MFHDVPPGRHVFSTEHGPCGVAWTAAGVDRFELPHRDAAAAAAALARRAPDRPDTPRPPAPVRDLVKRVRAHLAGRPDPFADVPLDLGSRTPFARAVAQELRAVPPGSTVTYGELAARAGSPGAARAVGGVMATNPTPLLVPCHRVLPGGRGAGAFSGPGGPRQKEHLLLVEGVVLDPQLAAAYAHLTRADRRLGRLITRYGPYAPGFGSGEDPWVILVTSIVHQQLSLKAAGTILNRVKALTPGDGPPTPRRMARLDDDALRGCGLSRAKVSFLKDLAARVLDGRLDLASLDTMSDEEAVTALTAVKGIGTWTAQMALIFHLGRLDVWPVGDLGMRNGLRLHLGLDEAPDEKAAGPLGDRYAPYRSLAAWYLWALVDGEPI
ncbi:MAG TPA: methylated-DNA--[protein]-cysteine S-methyltransferase [Candidatus Krumholzibacteria bacterium]|nr:methylated-DNA--[protein]-cysteine S-methyltransferase [Candidatus Krumholzibacteria bacterium]HRX51042.1 methylated-DNA--[protein]-cysteine S-methyltransferase [Candidatus Krumholzibacteria bacterium]